MSNNGRKSIFGIQNFRHIDILSESYQVVNTNDACKEA